MAKGIGYARYVGWVVDEETGERRFEAHVVFPDGPPDLPCKTVWDMEPVTIVRVEAGVTP